MGIKKVGTLNKVEVHNERVGLNEQILNLQYQYLTAEDQNIKADILSELASLYWNEGKKNLAYICLCESLRLNPYQIEIANILESINENDTGCRKLQLQENKCTVSVIIPTYNRTLELKESIASVINQTFQDYEVIVINDGGPDVAKRIADSFRSNKIHYYKLSKNKGRPGARNEGLVRAKGKYIAYLDDDDIFYDNHLEILVNFMEVHPKIDVAYTNAWWVYGEIGNNKFKPHYKKTYGGRPNKFNKNKLFEGNYISTLNIMHKKSSLVEVGIFNEELPQLEDWDLLLRMATKLTFQQINQITGEYRWRDNNLSVLGKSEMNFWNSMLGSYYSFFRGKVALAKYYLYKSEFNKADEYLDEIKDEYPNYYKNAISLREISDISLGIGELTFLKTLTKDYFKLMPRECLKLMIEKKSFAMASVILPRFPKRAIESAIGRFKKKFIH